MKEKIEKILETKINPMLAMENGSVELVEVTDGGVVKVKLTGACAGCPMSSMTLKMFVEQVLKEEIPEIKSVESV